jgi:ribosome-binding factor A
LSRRLLKAASAIREVVSMAILTELRDPRVQNVTVVGVEVAPDMRSAKVAVSIMGAENKQQLTLNALQRAAGFLQSKIADRIDTRYTPKLTFVMDRGVKHSLEVLRILNEVLPPEGQTPNSAQLDTDDSEEPEDDSLPNDLEADDLEADDTEPDAENDEANDFDDSAGSEPAKPR